MKSQINIVRIRLYNRLQLYDTQFAQKFLTETIGENECQTINRGLRL